ncbi:MAG: DUF126 domain-containing protein [Ardenticatenaceae bacterium]|nr:DUF126 domain-containing protein [Ardenticatenaceae bacterium]
MTTNITSQFQAKVLVPGSGSGLALVLAEPLSLWGGLNPESGEIIDRRHPQAGQIVTNRVLVLPSGRGSSSASSILLEAVKQGTAPAAIITSETDGILALGAAVAREMYDQAPPVLVLDREAYSHLQTGQQISVTETGLLTVSAS